MEKDRSKKSCLILLLTFLNLGISGIIGLAKTEVNKYEKNAYGNSSALSVHAPCSSSACVHR